MLRCLTIALTANYGLHDVSLFRTYTSWSAEEINREVPSKETKGIRISKNSGFKDRISHSRFMASGYKNLL